MKKRIYIHLLIFVTFVIHHKTTVLLDKILRICQNVIPAWKELTVSDFDFDDPKGFSSFTMGVRCKNQNIEPKAILYRQLEGKENAILDFETEKEIFILLGENDVAAHCLYYDDHCRIEAFYQGRTLEVADLFKPENLKKIANRLYKFHQVQPKNLPSKGLFELIHDQWGVLAKNVLENHLDKFPQNEQKMCLELKEIYSEEIRLKVQKHLPKEQMTFCHNDTYHGNIFKLDTGDIKLLDFEFSCLNHKAYDFSNLFAETVMVHKQKDYPYFKIKEPEYGGKELSMIIGYYLDNATFNSEKERENEANVLLQQAKQLTRMSDYKYAMAAITLSIDPIQNIRFIPYAYERFLKFKKAFE